MTVQTSFGTLLFYAPSQIAGKLQLSTQVVTCIEGRRGLPFVPLAFAFAEACNVTELYDVAAGRYSPHHQVWEYDPDLEGSSGLVPRSRRIAKS